MHFRIMEHNESTPEHRSENSKNNSSETFYEQAEFQKLNILVLGTLNIKYV